MPNPIAMQFFPRPETTPSAFPPTSFSVPAPLEGDTGIRGEDGRTYGEKMSQKPNVSGEKLFDYKPAASTGGGKVGNIWGDFSQWNKANCSTVAAIKAVMMQFGKRPTDVFKSVRETADGYHVTLRNGESTFLTKDELKQAAAVAQLKGEDPMTVLYANFMFAVSAKRYQESGPASFTEAMHVLNSGGRLEYAFRRLGVWDEVEGVPPEQLAQGRMGVYESNGHAALVFKGREERWGKRGGPSPTKAIEVAYAFKNRAVSSNGHWRWLASRV